jgi:hypothetical protein
MEPWLANGSGVSPTASNITGIVVGIIAGAVSVLTLYVALTQLRTSLRNQRKSEEADARLTEVIDKQREEFITEAERKGKELPGASREQPDGAPKTTISYVPARRMLAEETQYEILRKYHHQGLSQSRVSFWFSLAFASLGFLLIATATLTVDRDKALSQQSAAVIALLSGTVVDLVAGLFFAQSRRAQRVMQEFFDSLRKDRKLEESLKLADKVEDKDLQSKVQAQLALHFAEINHSDALLSALLGLHLPAIEPLVRPVNAAEPKEEASR